MTLGKVFKAVLLGGVIFCAGAGVYAVAEKAKSASVFTISSVEVKGVINADREALAALSKKLIGLNIFDDSIESLMVTDDPWVQKLTANRVLPSSVSLVVFEEKPLFYYRSGDRCYIFTGSDRHMAASCDGVRVRAEGRLDNDKAKKFVSILAVNPVLAHADIVLKEYNFTALIEGQLLICPYDKGLFTENYGVYAAFVKQRYKRVDYVDLTVGERIFVKGDQNGSGKG